MLSLRRCLYAFTIKVPGSADTADTQITRRIVTIAITIVAGGLRRTTSNWIAWGGGWTYELGVGGCSGTEGSLLMETQI